MKKQILFWILALVICNTAIVFGDTDLKVLVEGNVVDFPDVQPCVIDDTDYVPLRHVVEAMDAQIDWEQESQTVVITKESVQLVLHVGSNIIFKCEDVIYNSLMKDQYVVAESSAIIEKSMDAVPIILEDRVLLPVDVIATEFGYTIDWSNASKTVYIYTIPTDEISDVIFDNNESVSTTLEQPVTILGLTKQHISEHFNFYSNDINKIHIDRISMVFEEAYVRLSAKFAIDIPENINVWIHPDYKSYCEATGIPYSPDIIHPRVSGSTRTVLWSNNACEIHVTTPYDDYMVDNDNTYDKVLVHELVHVISNQIKSFRELSYKYLWLAEGLADYESGVFALESCQSYLSGFVINDIIPSLDDLEINDLVTFVGRDGYMYGASIIEFIDVTYGFDKVVEIYAQPEEYEAVFGCSRQEFEMQWKLFLNENHR